MKPFKFKLEKILGLREFKEEEVRNELGRIRGELTRAVLRKQALQEESVRSRAEMLNEAGNISCLDIIDYDNYSRGLKRQIENQDLIILEIKEQEAKVIARYMEARKDRLVLEKLKEKKIFLYKQDAIKEEKKIISEIVLNKATRKLEDLEQAEI